jgi:hypothetical protein
MGVGLGLLFDKEIPEAAAFSSFTDGKDLARAIPVLDEICNKEGLTPFSTFAPDFEQLEDELPLEEVYGDHLYHACSECLGVIPKVVAALQADKQWSRKLGSKCAATVVATLAELERLLKIGKRKGVRFYLLYY